MVAHLIANHVRVSSLAYESQRRLSRRVLGVVIMTIYNNDYTYDFKFSLKYNHNYFVTIKSITRS